MTVITFWAKSSSDIWGVDLHVSIAMNEMIEDKECAVEDKMQRLASVNLWSESTGKGLSYCVVNDEGENECLEEPHPGSG